MILEQSVDAFHIFSDHLAKKNAIKNAGCNSAPQNGFDFIKIKKGGYLYFVTDWLPYAVFGLEQLSYPPKEYVRWILPASGLATGKPGLNEKGLDANRVDKWDDVQKI